MLDVRAALGVEKSYLRIPAPRALEQGDCEGGQRDYERKTGQEPSCLPAVRRWTVSFHFILHLLSPHLNRLNAAASFGTRRPQALPKILAGADIKCKGAHQKIWGWHPAQASDRAA